MTTGRTRYDRSGRLAHCPAFWRRTASLAHSLSDAMRLAHPRLVKFTTGLDVWQNMFFVQKPTLIVAIHKRKLITSV